MVVVVAAVAALVVVGGGGSGGGGGDGGEGEEETLKRELKPYGEHTDYNLIRGYKSVNIRLIPNNHLMLYIDQDIKIGKFLPLLSLNGFLRTPQSPPRYFPDVHA